MKPRPCRSCRRPIYVLQVDGRDTWMPIDMDPDRYRGNIRINPDQTIEVLGPLEATACRLDGDALYISHFTTCPHAKQHRRNQ